MAFNLNLEKKESINKCIRFPVKVISNIEKIAEDNNISFSKFVIQACEYAIKDIETQKKKEKIKS
ncbi:MAG: hypothetical protein HFI36_01925 [Bacilli bacterium]|jgi:hypothetical protein|nr:hypothetical protein [Bacilli bacterium]